MNKKVFLIIIATIFFFSCQREERTISPVTQEDGFLEGNSSLLNLMRSVSLNDGSFDNAIDSTSALSVVFPIQVKLNGDLMEIDSVEMVKEKIDEYTDELELVFPLVTIAYDFSEITFFDTGQLRQYRQENPAPTDDIEAVDFVYPISFASYSLDSQTAETIFIEDDEALYYFLENPSEQTLVSLNYPIELKYHDGSILNIGSNQELESALLDIPTDYDEMDDPYNQNEIEPALTLCYWTFGQSNDVLVFKEDGTLSVNLGGETGTWELKIGKEDVLSLAVETGEFAFEGDWTISAFKAGSEGYSLSFYGETNLSMAQHCPPDGSCTDTITECETSPGFAQFNLEEFKVCAAQLAGLDPQTATVEYYDSLAGAQNENNPINNTVAYTNQTPNSQTIYARVEDQATQQVVIVDIVLQVEDC